MNKTLHNYLIFETAGGFCGIAWSDAGITRFQLPTKSADATERLMHKRLPDAEPGMPTAEVLPVKISDKPTVMLEADLENENNTIRNYRERVLQCEALQEYAVAEDIREILRQEQEHQIDLATALGRDVPDVSHASTHR